MKIYFYTLCLALSWGCQAQPGGESNTGNNPEPQEPRQPVENNKHLELGGNKQMVCDLGALPQASKDCQMSTATVQILEQLQSQMGKVFLADLNMKWVQNLPPKSFSGMACFKTRYCSLEK